VKQFQDKYQLLDKKFAIAESSQADKIEKNLVKNLLIGYIVAPNANDKVQILKLIAHVLELNQLESDKVGLGNKTSQGGWLGGILSSGSNLNQGKLLHN
jgi:thyroid receptor-interacting protein 11